MEPPEGADTTSDSIAVTANEPLSVLPPRNRHDTAYLHSSQLEQSQTSSQALHTESHPSPSSRALLSAVSLSNQSIVAAPTPSASSQLSDSITQGHENNVRVSRGIADYIVGETQPASPQIATPKSQPNRSVSHRKQKIKPPKVPWYCVSRPIREQTKDLKIRVVNLSRSINTSRLIEKCRSMLEFCSLKLSEAELNESNISELNYNHHWGDSLPGNVKGNTLRVVYQNVQRGISIKDNAVTNSVLNKVHTMEADVFMASETNCNWKTADFRNNIQQTVKKNWPNHRLAFSSSDVGVELAFHEFLPGGTCTMAFDHVGMRVIKAGEDDSGLGRWSFITVEGQDKRRITFITAYRICGGPMKGTTTSCSQQRRVINNQEMKRGVQTSRPDTTYLSQKFVEDLTRFILSLQEEGNAIVLGLDANETLEEASTPNGTKLGSITKLLEDTGLSDVFLERHGALPDSSTTTPGRYIDRLAVSGVTIQRATVLRANEPSLSDHLALVVDIDLKILFNNPCSPLSSPLHRKLTSTNPDAVKQYIAFIQTQFAEHKIVDRCARLKEASRANFTDHHRRQLFALDTQITEILLGAERRCSPKRSARNVWSPALRKAGQEVTY